MTVITPQRKAVFERVAVVTLVQNIKIGVNVEKRSSKLIMVHQTTAAWMAHLSSVKVMGTVHWEEC